MTSMDKPAEPLQASTLDQLIKGVSDLTESVEKDRLQRAKERKEDGRKRLWDRFWISLTAVGLALDLVLSGLFIHQHSVQSTLNDRIDCQNRLNGKKSDLRDDDTSLMVALITTFGSGEVTTPAEFTELIKTFNGKIAHDNLVRASLKPCN